MRTPAAFALALLASPAGATDHPALAARTLDAHILPGFEALAAETEALAAGARATCADAAAEPPTDAYHRAFDAWIDVAHLRFGPTEDGDAGFAIAFWPDTRGATPRALAALTAAEDPVVDDPAAFAEVSVAARGLFALEALLFEPGASPPAAGGYSCRLIPAVASDLAATAAGVLARWRHPYAGYLTSAGAADNPLYLAPEEATRAIYTALLSGLQTTADLRLGRPLGAFERPQPRRAEAWRSGRSLRNVTRAVEAARDLYATAFAPELAEASRAGVVRAFAAALAAADRVGMPLDAAVTDPSGRLRVEALQQAIERLRAALASAIGPTLGIAGGFNSMDGD